MQPASRPLQDDGPYRLARAHFFFTLTEISRDPSFEEARYNFLKDFIKKLVAADAALKEISDIIWEAPWKVANKTLHQEIMQIRGQLDVTDPPEKFSESVRNLPSPPLWDALMAHGDDIERARDAIFGLVEIAVKEATTTRVIKNVGPQQVLWKRDFIFRMSALWQLLTGEKASKAEDSLFGGFVYAAWDSLGPNMPEVSFARAIREHSAPT